MMIYDDDDCFDADMSFFWMNMTMMIVVMIMTIEHILKAHWKGKANVDDNDFDNEDEW